ncbi:MAG: zinc-binding alcohol dehydrogenase [Hyphomicrobiaceae bacterium]
MPKSRRAAGLRRIATSLWYADKGKVERRMAPLDPPRPGEALVRTLFTGISRGTERLVFSGAVGPSEWERMKAPFQDGAFPFPVKYGYCAVGVVDIGPPELQGRTVFCLHPHQDCFNAPVGMLVPVPDSIPARRATLAANMETALNALWDSGAGPGDRIVVVGCGIVGLLIGYLAAGMPGAEVTLVDVAEERRALVETLGAAFALPGDAPRGADVVFHTSVTQAGLNTAIDSAGMEGTIVELSWYGEKPVSIGLGGAFHSQRLKIVSSQVGQVSPGRRPRWDYRRRMEAALRLLDDARLDALVEEDVRFADAVAALPAILAPGAGGLAPVIRYTE